MKENKLDRMFCLCYTECGIRCTYTIWENHHIVYYTVLYRSKSKKIKDKTKHNTQNERRSEKKKQKRTKWGEEKNDDDHHVGQVRMSNTHECWWVCVRECVYISVSVCNIMAVLFNMRTHDIFSFTLFSRYIVYVARLFFAAKHYKRDTHTHTHTYNQCQFFLSCTKHTNLLFFIYTDARIHTHILKYHNQEMDLLFFFRSLSKKQRID